MPTSIRIGILALQGAFAEHEYSLNHASKSLPSNADGTSVTMDITQIRRPQDVLGLDGLIIPGGESTTMSKFLERNNFKQTLDNWMKGENGSRPVVWGTCAGLILLANNVTDLKQGGQLTLGGVDITASRNIFGRQNESFEAKVRLINDVINCGETALSRDYKGVFIRAPGVVSVDCDDVQVLAVLDTAGQESRPVAVQQNNLIVTSFHPELTEDFRWHSFFLRRVLKNIELGNDP